MIKIFDIIFNKLYFYLYYFTTTTWTGANIEFKPETTAVSSGEHLVRTCVKYNKVFKFYYILYLIFYIL
jgi:hypothetical protein